MNQRGGWAEGAGPCQNLPRDTSPWQGSSAPALVSNTGYDSFQIKQLCGPLTGRPPGQESHTVGATYRGDFTGPESGHWEGGAVHTLPDDERDLCHRKHGEQSHEGEAQAS